MKYLIANWKSNKKLAEVEKFFTEINKLYQNDRKHNFDNLEIAVCLPFIYLPLARKLIEKYVLPIKLGGQDVSPFQEGAYTGEVTAGMLSEFAEYVIIGHSERRKYFGEDDKLLSQKADQASRMKLKTIFCIQSEKTFIPKGVLITAYEPLKAIGTGQPETPEKAFETAKLVKKKGRSRIVLYGGSVTPDNIRRFLNFNEIDGVLVGGASLDPFSFWEMIINASSL